MNSRDREAGWSVRSSGAVRGDHRGYHGLHSFGPEREDAGHERIRTIEASCRPRVRAYG
jgi:hypothetical protein